MASSKNQVSSVSFFSSPSSFSETQVPIYGHSKSQMCLRKIMGIILYDSSTKHRGFSKLPWWKLENRRFETFETDEERNKAVERVSCEENEQKIDLSLRLGPPENKEDVNLRDNRDFDGDSDSACSAVGETVGCAGKVRRLDCNSSVESAFQKSSQGECDPKSDEKLPEKFRPDGEEGRDFSEITIIQSSQGKCDERSSNGDVEFAHDDGNEKIKEEEDEDEEEEGMKNEVTVEVEEKEDKTRRRSEGYLDLLIEAVRLVSGNLIEVEKESEIETESIPAKSKSRRSSNNNNNKRCWWMLEGLFDDSAPVVKSKRGRNQVLPSRYRDSVLEPWKRLPRLPRSKPSKP